MSRCGPATDECVTYAGGTGHVCGWHKSVGLGIVVPTCEHKVRVLHETSVDLREVLRAAGTKMVGTAAWEVWGVEGVCNLLSSFLDRMRKGSK